MIHCLYYLEVLSSWCHWAEPTWQAAKARYAGQPVVFEWRIAAMPIAAFPTSRDNMAWFYRRSGLVTQAPYCLNTGWLEEDPARYAVPNQIAEAARAFGVVDDRVRLALAEAAVVRGIRLGDVATAAAVAVAAAPELNLAALIAQAQSPEVVAVIARSSAEFDRYGVDQRPTFVIASEIGDRAILSGNWRPEPLFAAIDAQLADARAYRSFAAHFGPPPGA